MYVERRIDQASLHSPLRMALTHLLGRVGRCMIHIDFIMSKNFWDIDMQASSTWKWLFAKRTLDQFLTEQSEMQEAEPDLQHTVITRGPWGRFR